MLTYEMFKEVFTDEFLDHMPEEYRHYDMRTGSVQKINQQLDSITLGEPSMQSQSVGVTLYINNYYEQYKVNNDINAVLMAATADMVNGIKNMPDINPNLDFSTAKDNIIFQLINTKMNEEMLKNVPSREVEDLSVIYRWALSADEDGLMSTMVTNQLAERIGLCEAELFEVAKENTKRIAPPTVATMFDVMKNMLRQDGLPEEFIDEMIEEDHPMAQMYVISNKFTLNGAASILYDEPLAEVAQRLGSNLYILPSSIHETIVLPVETGDPRELSEMVKEINEGTVAESERLSDNVYFYDKDEHTITLANQKESLLDKIKDAAKELEQPFGKASGMQREVGYSY